MNEHSQEPAKLLLNLREAAAALGIGETTLRTLKDKGEIPAVKIGGSLRFAVVDLQAYIERNKIEPASGLERKEAVLSFHETNRPALLLIARRALLEAALQNGSGTADDVRSAVKFADAIDARFLGAVPIALAKAGIIRRDGDLQSCRPECNARRISKWKIADRQKAESWLEQNPAPPINSQDSNHQQHGGNGDGSNQND